MVVKTLIKQSFISIKQTFNRFISILVIVLLGVGFFTGIRETSPNMKDSLDEYFKKENVYDISLMSTWGITKAELAKRMGMLPSSLYRKLARESMSLEELQNCLDVLGVRIEFNLQYPDGKVRSSQANYEMLLERMDLLVKELETAKKEIGRAHV